MTTPIRWAKLVLPVTVGLKARNKYKAKKVWDDGHCFDSQAEHRRYCELKLLQKAKEIKDLKIHPEYRIMINGKKVCIVELDFEYEDSRGTVTTEDVKGCDTALSRLKRKLVEAAHDIKVEIIKAR